MDFSHYNRDTAFGYAEDESGNISLTIYLGGDNVKDFSIITGGMTDIVRLKQLIRGARLEGDHIKGSDKKAAQAEKVLGDAGIKVWLTPDDEMLEKAFDESLASDTSEKIELIMDSAQIAAKLKDDNRISRISLIAYSHYGYDNNYTRAHEETELVIEMMPEFIREKAAAIKGDFEIKVENIVKHGLGDTPGTETDSEKRIYGAFYSYNVKNGELCASEISCEDPEGEILSCPGCHCGIDYDFIKDNLKYIADDGLICPHCQKKVTASEFKRSLRNAAFFYKKRDLMPVYIAQDDIGCVSFLDNGCSEERIEKYLAQAMAQKRNNCIAALLDYKNRHFAKKDFLDMFELSDDFEGEALGNDIAAGPVSTAAGDYGGPAAGSLRKEAGEGEVTFGSYRGEPIRWRVLSIVDDAALIITEECIDSGNYNASYAKTTWEDSALRARLNTDFLKECFTDAERDLIMPVKVHNPDNFFTGSPGGEDTEDKVFLLNIDESDFYFDDWGARQAKAGKEALAKRAYVAGTGFTAWWLRSPGSDPYHAANVDYYGLANVIGFLVNYMSNCIRPAMWIRL